MTYIIKATDKRPDEIKGIVSIKTNNGIKKLYFESMQDARTSLFMALNPHLIELLKREEETHHEH